MRVLVFGGTTEGRHLAEALAQAGAGGDICVATAYGAGQLGGLPAGVQVLVGRLDAAAMQSLMQSGGYRVVVDATHPYATEATKNIRAAAKAAGLPCLRLLREHTESKGAGRWFSSVEEAAAALVETEGNILLATGSKELSAYTALPAYETRCYPRVLPTAEALAECARLGFTQSHIIAMQGPFSKALNLALMRQFEIAVLVTKEGGKAGGFAEKMAAAQEAGAQLFVVGRPPEEAGHTLDEVLDILQKEEGTR